MTKSDVLDKTDADSATRLNHSVLLAAVDGDNDLLRSISKLFLRNYPVLMAAIHDAIARDDTNALMRAAHTFQGSGGYFLTESARTKLVDLERMAREGTLSNAGERVAEIESEMEGLKPEVLMLAAEGLRSDEN